MDSFYDAPRHPPPFIDSGRLAAVPVVPEISVLCPSNAPINKFTPYNQWRHEQASLQTHNKENFVHNNQNNSILKKQVRFQGPSLPQRANEMKYQDNRPQINSPNFEQMYMANIPHRQLDLSVVDLPSAPEKDLSFVESVKQSSIEIKEKEMPKSYKEFLEIQKAANNVVLNDSITDIFNYRGYKNFDKSAPLEQDNKLKPEKLRLTTDHENNCILNKPQNDFFQSVSATIAQRASNRPKEPVLTFDLENRSFAPKEQQPVDYGKYQTTFNQHYIMRPTNDTNSAEMLKQTLNNVHLSTQQGNDIQRGNLNKCDETRVKCNCSSDACKTKISSEAEAIISKPDPDELSTKDLLKIIAQQSQQIAQQSTQLMLLQQQVTDLISKQTHFDVPRQQGHCCPLENIHQSSNRQRAEDNCTSTKQFLNTPVGNQNFSIGVMTSFEVAFQRPSHRHKNEFLQKQKAVFEPESPKIQEITETESTGSDKNIQVFDKIHLDNRETLVDGSMVFKEPIQVREPCPSPEPSINIEMNDFDDSDQDDDTSQVEATFYRNLMAQVNKILQKAQIETSEEMTYNMPASNAKTMHKVKEAMMRHLKKVGLDLPDIEESFQHSGSSSDQDNISFAVKQLLMKYLPTDYLAKLATKDCEDRQLTTKEKIGAIKTRPEFSFATVQYMKKYNLIANNQKSFHRASKHPQSESPKFLDISKLKQQPKLL